MRKHLYVVYEDTTTNKINQNDITHNDLLSAGYQVIAREVGYNSTRYEYVR